MTSWTARLDSTRRYRYHLGRFWDEGRPPVVWIMLNPSTATASADDPTIRRVVGFSRAWGFGSAEVVNLFALRAANPRLLVDSTDPVGPANDEAIAAAVSAADEVIAAWGNHGTIENPLTGLPRDEEVLELMARGEPWHCLGTTRHRQPRHPLYMPADSNLVEFLAS